jgi:hypothetical protein
MGLIDGIQQRDIAGPGRIERIRPNDNPAAVANHMTSDQAR